MDVPPRPPAYPDQSPTAEANDPQPTLYSPVVTETPGGTVTLIFSQDHPGFSDDWYQSRRSYIAMCALGRKSTDVPAHIDYDEKEDRVWSRVHGRLKSSIETHASSVVRDGFEDLQLPRTEVPQLRSTAERLTARSRFRFGSAIGIMPINDFYGSMEDSIFCATQYIRHPAFPDFSPEPDMIHEIVGHGSHLMNPRMADIYRAIGTQVRRTESDEILELISKMFWFTIESGLILEDKELKALGASLVSSSSDLAHISEAHCVPLDAGLVAQQDYRVDSLQGNLFYARSFDHLEDFVYGFLDKCQSVLPAPPGSGS